MAAPRVRPEIYRTFWTFAAERHRIFEEKLNGAWRPESTDPILSAFRFCNVFRAADRVSQHLIQNAAMANARLDEDDIFLRVLLHRLFCKPSTWELLEQEVGPIEVESFSPAAYDLVLERARAKGARLYTGAFILCANSAYGFARKHQNHLALVAAMLRGGAVSRVTAASTFAHVYEELRSWPLLGEFMAYQIAIDLNYSPIISFSEDDFTVPGPGARRGIRKIFVDLGDLSEVDSIHWLVDQQHVVEEQLGIKPPSLFGRPLHAIDCQNLLCEVDKYCRVAFPELLSNRTAIKQRYVHNPAPYRLQFPPEWELERAIPAQWRHRVHDPAPV